MTPQKADPSTPATAVSAAPARVAALSVPAVRMLHDRLLVRPDSDSAERMSGSGIVIPATAQMGRRTVWGRAVAVGQHVRQVEVGDRVLFDPEDRSEVELDGVAYVVMRERDIHAVADPTGGAEHTGLYL